MPTYEYSPSAFTSLGSNDIDFSQLHHEVAQQGFGVFLYDIRVDSHGDIDFKFAGSLSGAEKTTLDSVVANHTGSGLNVQELSVPNAEGESTTTSGSFQTKLVYTPGILEDGVKYRVGWYCEVCNSSTSGRTEVQIACDSNVVALPSIESEDSNDWVPFSGFCYLDEYTQVTQITIKYRRLSSGTAKIRRARLEITKAD